MFIVCWILPDWIYVVGGYYQAEGDTDYSNQLHHNGAIVDYPPKESTPYGTHLPHSIHLPDNDIIILLQIDGIILYFDIGNLTKMIYMIGYTWTS